MNNWIFEHNEGDTARYSLGEIGFNNMICIGINPSTATPENLDPTLRKVRNLANANGYDGWIMLNVYPQRATNPNGIHHQVDQVIHTENLAAIRNLVSEMPTAYIWAAWGTLIGKRPFLIECLRDLAESIGPDKNWVHLGELTKHNHPRHPLYLSSSSLFNEFDINEYIANHG